jgi:hypothetical protein
MASLRCWWHRLAMVSPYRRCRRAAHRNRLKRQHYNWAMGTPLSRRSHPSVSEKSKPAQGQDRGFATGQLGANETFRDRRSKVAFGSSREDPPSRQHRRSTFNSGNVANAHTAGSAQGGHSDHAGRTAQSDSAPNRGIYTVRIAAIRAGYRRVSTTARSRRSAMSA